MSDYILTHAQLIAARQRIGALLTGKAHDALSISLAATTEIASCNQRDHSRGGFRRSAEGERMIRYLGANPAAGCLVKA